jgi:hypothetical protein
LPEPTPITTVESFDEPFAAPHTTQTESRRALTPLLRPSQPLPTQRESGRITQAPQLI